MRSVLDMDISSDSLYLQEHAIDDVEVLGSADVLSPASGSELNAKIRSRAPKSRAALLEAHRQRVVPELLEEDLDETFVRGERSAAIGGGGLIHPTDLSEF